MSTGQSTRIGSVPNEEETDRLNYYIYICIAGVRAGEDGADPAGQHVRAGAAAGAADQAGGGEVGQREGEDHAREQEE